MSFPTVNGPIKSPSLNEFDLPTITDQSTGRSPTAGSFGRCRVTPASGRRPVQSQPAGRLRPGVDLAALHAQRAAEPAAVRGLRIGETGSIAVSSRADFGELSRDVSARQSPLSPLRGGTGFSRLFPGVSARPLTPAGLLFRPSA